MKFYNRNNELELLERTRLSAEVKINRNKINLNIVKEKAKVITEHIDGYQIEFTGYSIDDM